MSAKKGETMKKKYLWIILILLIVFTGMVYFYFKEDTVSSDTSSDTVREVTVGTQTIVKSITGSGEISSNLTEKLELNTYRYLKEVLVQENQFVAEGENILKYTNGTYLKAPYNCVITSITVGEVGEICTSMHNIEISDTVNLLMTLNVDESDLASVKVGQEVTITVNAYENKTYTGAITKINEIGTYAETGSKFKATIALVNDGEIKIGMSASCEIIIDKAENVIAVPVASVQTSGGNKYVVVVNEDGTTGNVSVTTGLANDAYVEIKSGLSGGETIQMIEVTNSSNSTNSIGGFRVQGLPSGGGGTMVRIDR